MDDTIGTLAALKRVVKPGKSLVLVHSPRFGDRRLARNIVRTSAVAFYYTGEALDPNAGEYHQRWPKARNFEPTERGFIIHDNCGRSDFYLEYEWAAECGID